MQPRYLNADLAKSLLQLQPLLSPIVVGGGAQAQACFSPSSEKLLQPASVIVRITWRVYACVALLIAGFFQMTGLHNESMAWVSRYIHSLKWTPLPLGVGFAVIAAQQYKHTRRREEAKSHGGVCLAQPWEIQTYKLLPLRHFSRLWGWVNGVHLPIWCRKTVLGSYVKTFGCNMSEAEEEDLTQYSSLSQLFRRGLRPGCRPVCAAALLTSPADGTVLVAGPVTCGTLAQIKGVQYSMRGFLGPAVWNGTGPLVSVTDDNDQCYHATCLRDPHANTLWQVVLYLAPGDYHRFHSPTEWSVVHRRHFPGELLSVSPSISAWIPDLFLLNERVSYCGRWAHGFFSMTAVGATNVGSIKVYFDKELKTNDRKWSRITFFDKKFTDNVELKRGGEFGEFNLGSTIVLVFEVPKGSVLNVISGQKVKVGEALVSPKSFAETISCEENGTKQQSKGINR